MYSKIKQFLNMVPKDLTSANEIYNFARNAYKQIMGFFPDGLDNVFLKRGAAEMQDVRQKVVKFPGGGKDKTNPFKTRPGEFGMTILDDTGKPVKTTTGETPESLMEKLVEMTNKNLEDRGLGSIKLGDKIPRPKNKKPDVDPELQAIEDQNKMFQDFSTRNMTGVEAMKEASSVIGRKGKYKNISEDDAKKLLEKLDERIKGDMGPMQSGDDPDLFADGGRIGFDKGGEAGFAGDQTEQSQPGDQPMEMPRNTGFQPMFPMPQKNIPGSGGIKELREFLQAMGAPELGMGYNFPVGQSGVLGVGVAPSGNVGMQFKMPLSGGRFGFKDGSKPPNPGRRNFMKLMAGLASLPVVGKLFKGAKVAEKVVQLKNTTTTMPAWFPQFVERFISKGVGKKVDQDLMQFENPDLPGVKLTKTDDGQVLVEGKNAYGEVYEIDYKPPGFELIDEKTGKAVKIPGEFRASDTRFRQVGPEMDDIDVDYETVENLDEILGGNSTKLEGFAKGTNKEKYTKGARAVDEADQASSYYQQDRADFNKGPEIDPTDYIDETQDFAKGGLAYMLGE